MHCLGRHGVRVNSLPNPEALSIAHAALSLEASPSGQSPAGPDPPQPKDQDKSGLRAPSPAESRDEGAALGLAAASGLEIGLESEVPAPREPMGTAADGPAPAPAPHQRHSSVVGGECGTPQLPMLQPTPAALAGEAAAEVCPAEPPLPTTQPADEATQAAPSAGPLPAAEQLRGEEAAAASPASPPLPAAQPEAQEALAASPTGPPLPVVRPGGQASPVSVKGLFRGSPKSRKQGTPLGHSPTQAKAGKFGDLFVYTASRDLPAEKRTLVEDNKMLGEELRRARQRALEQDAALAAQQRQVLGLREEVERLKTMLQACSVSPAALLQEKDFRAQLAQSEAARRQLEGKVGVLERGRDSAERRHRADLTVERRAAEAAKAEAAKLKEALADKDRQARMTALHVRSLYQRLEALEALARGLPPLPPPEELERVRSPSPAPREESVHLMLCLVHHKQQPTAAEQAERARLVVVEAAYQALMRQQQRQAALQIQSHYRAFRARQLLQRHRQAATTIQAHMRGFLARRALVAVLEAASKERPSPLPSSPQDCMRERQLAAMQRHALRGAALRKGFQEDPSRGPRRRRQSEFSVQPARQAGAGPEVAAGPRQLQRTSSPKSAAGEPQRSGRGSECPAPAAVAARRASMGLAAAAAGPVPKLALAAGSRSFKQQGTPTPRIGGSVPGA